MKRALGVFCVLLALVAGAFASEILVPVTDDGTHTSGAYSGATFGGDEYPIGINLSMSGHLIDMYSIPTGSMNWYIYQSAQLVSGVQVGINPPRLLLENPAGPATIQGKSSCVIDNSNLLDAFTTAVSNKVSETQDHSWETGTYQFRVVFYTQNSFGSGSQGGFQHEFSISTYGSSTGDSSGGTTATGTSSGGTGSTSGGTGTTNDKGFWESLFVPSQTTINQLKMASSQFTTWGPFGLYTAVKSDLENKGNQDGAIDQTKYVIPVGTSYGSFSMDLRAYETFIKFARAIMAATLWWLVIWRSWKFVSERA